MTKLEAIETLKNAIRGIPFTPNAQKKWNKRFKAAIEALELECNPENKVISREAVLEAVAPKPKPRILRKDTD